jgi:hypothetical protein
MIYTETYGRRPSKGQRPYYLEGFFISPQKLIPIFHLLKMQT